jgi:phage terminase large subunit-like protein
VDLSSTSDLTAVVALIEADDGCFLVLPRLFVPEDGIRRRSEREGINYSLWAEQDHIVATAGAVVDYGVVEAYVEELCERFRCEAVAIDRWNSTATTTRLLDAGLPVIRFGQGFASMSPACKELQRLLLSRGLAHDGNPCMRWCLANVSIDQDAAGNIKVSKGRSRDKVDGITALAMAVGVAATEGRHTSVYAERPSFLLV